MNNTKDVNSILLSELSNDVMLWLTMNDAPKRNALSESMLTKLCDVTKIILSDTKVRVVVLAANGPAFCAGHDSKELTSWRETDDGGR